MIVMLSKAAISRHHLAGVVTPCTTLTGTVRMPTQLKIIFGELGYQDILVVLAYPYLESLVAARHSVYYN